LIWPGANLVVDGLAYLNAEIALYILRSR